MSQPHLGKKKILVVDDEADLTMLCRLALEYHGFEVDTFNDHPDFHLEIYYFC
jgi:DNA-binding response OmpR family regulator